MISQNIKKGELKMKKFIGETTPNAPQNPTELFKGSLDDYTVDIKHKGDMRINL